MEVFSVKREAKVRVVLGARSRGACRRSSAMLRARGAAAKVVLIQAGVGSARSREARGRVSTRHELVGHAAIPYDPLLPRMPVMSAYLPDQPPVPGSPRRCSRSPSGRRAAVPSTAAPLVLRTVLRSPLRPALRTALRSPTASDRLVSPWLRADALRAAGSRSSPSREPRCETHRLQGRCLLVILAWADASPRLAS